MILSTTATIFILIITTAIALQLISDYKASVIRNYQK